LSFLALLQSDQTTEALFIRLCANNRQAYAHYCERASVDRPDDVLTRWERLLVWIYTTTHGTWYQSINEPLRDGTPSDDVRALAHILGGALQKLPRHAGLVYRAIRVADLPSFLRGYQVGTTVEWGAFSSATIDRAKVLIGNVIFIVGSNNGRVLGPYADHQDELEVVFLPNSRFRIDGVEHTSSKAIIDLSELPLSTSEDKGE